MNLMPIDHMLLDGLQLLGDTEINRVQAHLAAGLPMCVGWGWVNDTTTADFGCLVGICMSKNEFKPHEFTSEYGKKTHTPLSNLARMTFPDWAEFMSERRLTHDRSNVSIPAETLERLAMLVDMEWARRQVGASVTIPEVVAIGS
jgi:hypothetical protein